MRKRNKLIPALMTVLMALLLTSCGHCSREKKKIAILCPFQHQTQIWNSFVNSAREEYSDTNRYDLHFYYVSAYVGTYWDKREYEHDVRYMLQRALTRVKKDNKNLDLIIIYGDDVANAVAKSDDPLLKQTPILCAGQVHPTWNERLPAMSNVVVMESEPAVKKNLDFIVAMGFPHYVVTVMDSTFVDDHIRENIMAEIGNDPEHYRPNLYLEEEDRIHQKQHRDSRITLIPVSTMWPEKNDRHPDVPGAFNLDWIFYTQQQETSFLHIKSDEYANKAMSYNIGPYFTMVPDHFDLPLINSLNSCIGGYFTPFPSMWKQVHPIVDKLLDGTPPKQIPWGKLEKDYWLDWRLVKQLHPYASDFPKGVKFVNLPFLQRSRTVNVLLEVLVVLLAAVFIVFAVIIPSLMAARQEKQKRQLYEKAAEADNSKKQVEYILSELNSYIWRMKRDRCVHFSPSFYRDFGIEERAIGLDKVLEYVHDPSREAFERLLNSDFFEGDKELEIMVRMPSDGSLRAVAVHIISISGNEEAGLKAGFFYFNDEAHKRHEELKQAYRRSEEIAEKESFLASMNDEFLKPVNEIVFFSRLLAERFSELPPQRKADCESKVMAANDSLMALLDSVMGDTIQSRDFDSVAINTVQVREFMEEIYVHSSVSKDGDSRIDFIPGNQNCGIESNRPVIIQVMNSLISDAVKNCKGRISIGWTENAAQEVVIFIDNAHPDVSQYAKMIESVGGRTEVLSFPGMPVRVEICFAVFPPREDGHIE